MPMPIRLEIFETLNDEGAPQLLSPEQIEEIRLNAYERGFIAGWEDAGRQAEAEDHARRAEVERQLQQLAFTYHEVRGHLLRALLPVFEAVLDSVVPVAARSTVVPMAVEELLALAGKALDAPVTLKISPGTRGEYDAALDGLILPPLNIDESEEIAPLQAAIAFDAQETQIDLDAIAAQMRAAIERFYLIQTEEVSHG